METKLVIYWMKIYPLDSVIHLLNNLRRMTFELTTLFRATNHPDRSLGLASLWLKNAFTRVVLSVWAANRVINVWAFCDALTHRITSLRYLADTMEWALDWQTGIVRMLYLQQNKGKYEVIFTRHRTTNHSKQNQVTGQLLDENIFVAWCTITE